MKFLLFFLMVSAGIMVLAQDHEVIFPDLEGEDLLEAVTDNFTPGFVMSYGAARDVLFGTIDSVNDSLYCVYTGWPVYLTPGADPTQAAFQNGQGINTEHSWPRSLGADSEPARADMHHLFPTRVDVNQARGNLPYGEISDASTDEWYYLNQEMSNPPLSNRDAWSEYRANDAFEPREDFKGNVARALMYFYTIYRDEANANAPSFFAEQRATLCLWHEQDLVDEVEFARTMAIADRQDGKPNPFVVDCTLPSRLYCQEVPSNSCAVSALAFNYQELSATFFPNPIAADRAGQLQLTTEEAGLLSIRFHDPLGRVVQNREMLVNSGEVSVALELPGAGFWYCEVVLQAGENWYRELLPVVAE